MATPQQIAALTSLYHAAQAAGHIFPAAAACEGVVESSWATSQLFIRANNVFGTKQHVQPIYSTIMLPTQEYLHGEWVTITAAWVAYPTLAASFKDRMATLQRLAPTYPHYAAALAAKTPEDYLTQVSLSWSTGPNRAQECIAILHAHPEAFQ